MATSVIPKTYEQHIANAAGYLFNSGEDSIDGAGYAAITFLSEHLARVDFGIKIVHAPTRSTFLYGINRDILSNVAGVPQLTPIEGGCVQYKNSNGSINTGLAEFCGTMRSGEQFWVPSRVYTESGDIGAWGSTAFSVGMIIEGCCFGTY